MELRKLNKSDYKKLMEEKCDSDLNRNYISIVITDFDYEPGKISTKLNLEPTSIGIKGEEYLVCGIKGNTKVREYNHWEFEWQLNTNEFIGDIAERFMNEIISPRFEEFRQLGSGAEIMFRIVQYYYGSCNIGIGFRRQYVKILAEINAAVDIDLYCLSD